MREINYEEIRKTPDEIKMNVIMKLIDSEGGVPIDLCSEFPEEVREIREFNNLPKEAKEEHRFIKEMGWELYKDSDIFRTSMEVYYSDTYKAATIEEYLSQYYVDRREKRLKQLLG